MEKLKKLTPKQYRFVVALAGSRTVKEAIATAKITEKTAYRWLKDSYFQDQLRKARRDVLFQATGELTAAVSGAIGTLSAIMDDDTQPASARVSAARTILDTAFNAIQADDLQERVEAIEKGQEAIS